MKPVGKRKGSDVPYIWFLEAVEQMGGKPDRPALEWAELVAARAEANYRAAMNAQSPG